MCTLVILRRPGHDWPLMIAANRDEMATRPWLPPARHWADRPELTAGQDALAGGTWLGLNDWGVIAGVLNRPGSLGPDESLRSRGELPLDALDHAEAKVAAEAMAAIEPNSYRTFNLVVADARDAYWLSSEGGGKAIRAAPVPDGVSMVTAHDLNDTASPRIRHFLPLFEAAPPPDPEAGKWGDWQALMATPATETEPDIAMTIATDTGFGTVSSSLLALPDPLLAGVKPRWLFAPGPPDKTAYEPIDL